MREVTLFLQVHQVLDAYDLYDHTHRYTPLYTGNVSPDKWFPLRFDGYDNDLGVETNTPFVNGGAGSYLSRAAVSAMDIASCIESSLPNHEWWKMQSDWMIGLCTERAGFGPTTLNEGIFNSFA